MTDMIRDDMWDQVFRFTAYFWGSGILFRILVVGTWLYVVTWVVLKIGGGWGPGLTGLDPISLGDITVGIYIECSHPRPHPSLSLCRGGSKKQHYSCRPCGARRARGTGITLSRDRHVTL